MAVALLSSLGKLELRPGVSTTPVESLRLIQNSYGKYIWPDTQAARRGRFGLPQGRRSAVTSVA